MGVYRWVSQCDDQTCVECQTMHGKTVSQKEIDGGLRPPFHDECRCVLELIDVQRVEVRRRI